MKVNFKNPWFETRFNRKPRSWTIEEIHELYLRAKERSEKRWLDRSNYINEIVSSLSPENDEFSIYADYKYGIIKYNFSKSIYYKGYGISNSKLEFSKDKVQARNEKISFLINNEKAFEFGNKYRELDKLTSYLHQVVLRVMWGIIEDNLRESFKKSKTIPDDVFIINIDKHKYFVKTDEQSKYGYMKFSLSNEFKDKTIDIKNI